MLYSRLLLIWHVRDFSDAELPENPVIFILITKRESRSAVSLISELGATDVNSTRERVSYLSQCNS